MSDVGTVLDALRLAWKNVLSPSGVNVFSAPVSIDQGGEECIYISDGTLVDDDFAMGGNRLEVWSVKGEAYIRKPYQGGATAPDAIEAAAKAARDRAQAIISACETSVNDTYVSQYPNVAFTNGELVQNFADQYRVCGRQFTLTIKILKNP